MAEKGDAPADQVSLPPNYAHSETFTDSPPPAYRGPGTATVKIVKLICMTVFFLTVFLCLFFLGYKYLHNQSLSQSQQYEPINFEESAYPGESAPLVSKAGVANLDLNNNIIEEFVEAKEKQKAEKELLEGEMQQDANAEEQLIKEEVQEIQNSFKEDPEQLTPPSPFDILLGKKPLMAGPGNVKCKVQKRKHKIGDDIIAQAVIVKCDDEEENDEKPTKMRPLGPPLSLLGNIMKALASKASRQLPEEPKFRQIPLRPMNPIFNSQVPHPRPMPIPFEGPPRKLVHFIPLNRIAGPKPFDRQGPPPFLEPQRGPFPPFPFIPLKKIEEPRFNGMPENPPPFFHPRTEEEKPRPLLNIIPLRRIAETNRLEAIAEPNEIFRPRNGPMEPISFLKPIKIIREDVFPVEREEENHHHHHHPHQEGPMPGPFPFPPQNRPVKIVRIFKNDNEIEEFPEMNDAPFHHNKPVVRFMPREARKIVHFHREPVELPFGPLPIRGGFPLPRGALPMGPLMNEPNMNALPVPQAKPRAIPRPMALPGAVRRFRLPFPPRFPPMSDMQPLPEVQVSTHMEMRDGPPPPPFPLEEEPRPFPPQEIFHPDEYPEQVEDFGPPKDHTLIEPYMEEEEEEGQQHPIIVPPPFIREELNPGPIDFPPQEPTEFPQPPQPLLSFGDVPPPSFNPEGRFSPMAEIEPEAEMLPEDIQGPEEPLEVFPETIVEESQ